MWDFQKALWRGAPKFAMRFSLVAEDGSIEIIESFKVCDSPILFDDYRCGEYYDARLEIDNFHTVGYDDSGLRNAIKAESPKGEKRLCTADPVRFYKELNPVSINRCLNNHGNNKIWNRSDRNYIIRKSADELSAFLHTESLYGFPKYDIIIICKAVE